METLCLVIILFCIVPQFIDNTVALNSEVLLVIGQE